VFSLYLIIRELSIDGILTRGKRKGNGGYENAKACMQL
jgi:hypothetical protein